MAEKAVDDSEDFDLTFAFSCGGWFQMYFCGAGQAIADSGVLEKFAAEGKRVRFCGVSAGSLPALWLASGKRSFKEIKEFAIECGEHYRSSWCYIFYVKSYLDAALEKFCGHLKVLEENSELKKKINGGSLEVYATTLPLMKKKVITHFEAYEDVTEAIRASCCLMPIVGIPFRMRNTREWVCDGAMATLTPRKGEPRTITISAFYFSTATVHPTVFVPVWWGLRPPGRVAHNNLFTLAYNDMIVGLVTNNLLSPKEGDALLRPEVHFEFDENIFMRIWAHILDVLVRVFIRPVVVVCIYVELVFVVIFSFFKGAVFLRSESLSHIYDNLKNILSPRTLGRLVFSSKVRHNEKRLKRGSRLYRVFDPVCLGGKKTNGREIMSPAGVLKRQMPSFFSTTE